MPVETILLKSRKMSTNLDTTYWDEILCKDCEQVLGFETEVHICRIWATLHMPGCYCYSTWSTQPGAKYSDFLNARADPVRVRFYRHTRLHLPIEDWEDYDTLHFY